MPPIDENLSPRLVGLLDDVFPGSAHLDHVGLHGHPDEAIWAYARESGFVLASKDNDFRQLSFLRGTPPKVIWLRIGNAPTSAVADLLRTKKAVIEAFSEESETALLEISVNRAWPL